MSFQTFFFFLNFTKTYSLVFLFERQLLISLSVLNLFWFDLQKNKFDFCSFGLPDVLKNKS